MRHVEFQYAGRTTNLEYGGFSIDGNSQTMDGFEEMTDLTFFETKLSGIDVYNARGRQTINNTAFYASTTTGVHGVWLRQGSIVTLNALVVYRHQFGVTSIWSQGGTAVILNNPWFLGCYSRCINLDSAQGWEINNPRITSSVDGIFNQTGAAHTVNGGHIGMDTANGAEYTASLLNAFSAANTTLGVILTKDTSYNYTTAMVKNLALAIPGTQFIVSNRDVDPLLQEIHAPTGSIYRDNTTVRTAGTASLRMEPTSSTDALSNTWNIIAPDSTPVAISAFVRKNSTYGSSNLPSITISGLGITPVTSTMADVNDSWELVSLTAMQTTGADGILTLTFDGQSAGAGARCFITDIAAPAATAITTGSLEYWADGQPAKLIAANFLSATDVWNAQVTDLAVAGSMGQYITQPFFMSPLEIDENVYENAQSIAISALTGKTITLKLYAASAPSVQVGSDIVMTEPVPEMYVARIDWSSISGLEPDYYYVQATSGIHSSVGIIEVHQVDPQERQLQHTTTNR